MEIRRPSSPTMPVGRASAPAAPARVAPAAPPVAAPTDELKLQAPPQRESKGFFGGLAAAVSGGIDWVGRNVGDQVGGAVQWAEKQVNAGIDFVEENAAKPAEWAAEKTKDIPLLGSVTAAYAWTQKQAAQVVGGVAKGATTMVAGVGQMVAHPVDAVKGLYSMAEHIPLLPVNPLRVLSAGYDVAVNGKDASETMLKAINPADMLSDSATFGKALLKGITEPYAESIREGKPAEAIGRGIFDIGSLVLTAGGGGAAKGAATVGADAAKIANVADDAGRVAKVASVADDAGRAAKVANVADDAGRLAKVAGLADELGRVAEGTPVVVRRSSGAIESGWRVEAPLPGGRLRVSKPGLGFKDITPEALLAENPQLSKAAQAVSKLPEGTAVAVRRSSGALDEGWRVERQWPDGRVRVSKPGVGVKDINPEALLTENPHLAADGVAGARAGAAAAGLKPAKSIDQAVAELVQKEGGVDKLRGMDPQRLGDKIYKEIYNPSGTPKPARMSQEAYREAIGKYDLAMDDGYWQRRFGKAGNVPEGDIQRVYFNVLPDSAPQLADRLTAELNREGIGFQYKMPSDLKNFNRSDAAVLYVGDADAARVQRIVERIAKEMPGGFAEGSPGFTKPVHTGIAIAEEPIQANLPARYGGHSFGTSRADIIAEAVSAAPPGATLEQVQALVRERFGRYGIDPDQPWLRQGGR